MIKFVDNFIIVESANNSLIFEIKDFDDCRTKFNKGKKIVTQFYYGLKDKCPELLPTKNNLPPNGSNNDYIIDKLVSSTYGNGNNREPSLLIENCDNTFVNRFFFKQARINTNEVKPRGPHSRNIKETLEIIEVDEVLNIELHLYYSLFENSDIIVSKREIINKGEKKCTIKRAFSLELPIESNSLEVETFDGAWLYERNRHISSISNGVFVIDSKIGASSAKHNPYFQALDKTKTDMVYGFNLIYSGNHKEQIEVNHLGYSCVMVGVNDFAFSYTLNTNESFLTPEAIFTLKQNKDELTMEMHNFAINHIVNPKFSNTVRPIIFNSWEGTGMNIDEKSLIEMAKVAKEVGIELFVMDDGWFINRKDDTGGLGDWEVDLDKFPNGLTHLVNQIKSIGLQFGIWVEPEMICLKSNLYEKHPEFACLIPNREPIEKRQQLMIDMSNPKVVEYLFNKLAALFEDIKPDYVKWDYNRFHADMYSSTNVNAGEFLYKTMLGTYDLFERLTNKFPNILFEGCSSGGGRFDLGLLYYAPQSWGSDDSNTYLRSFITCGTLQAYPQSSFGAHVSGDYCPLPNRNARSSLEDRFNLNCIGAFGYEFDLRKCDKEQIDIIQKQTSFYKEHANLLQFGDFYICKNIFDDNRYFSFSIVSKDKKEAIFFIEETENNVPPISWKVKGLKNNCIYEVCLRNQYNIKKGFCKDYKGSTLLEDGINIGNLNTTTDADKYPFGVFTRLFYIREK